MGMSNFRLLVLDRSGLRGPLAPALRDEAEKRPKMLRTLAALSRLTPAGINVLGLEAGLDAAGRFVARPTGLLARGMGGKVADAVTQAIAKRGKPLLVRNGELIYSLYQPAVPSIAAMKVLGSRLVKERTGRPWPATATLQVTTHCQLHCYHCSAARHRDLARRELATEELKSLIRQSEALGVVNIVFTGGEPLLRKDIYELIAHVNRDEANAMMFSNGLLLTEENVKKLKDAGLFSLYVSIDSAEPETHDRLRRVSRGWEQATAGLKRALDAGLLCGISTYADPRRLHHGEVMEVIELARRIGVHEVTVFDLVPTGSLLREEEEVLLTEQDKRELCRLEDEVNARPGYPQVVTQAHVNGPTGSGCFAAWQQFYATAYGDITPCDFTPLRFGNIREDTLAAIWRRMTAHPAYCAHSDHCRMQDPAFRRRWIDPIPAAGPFPYPAERLVPEEIASERQAV
jgi:MoaA/NifB/PqqE/SkfB family radical SAM enzyme